MVDGGSTDGTREIVNNFENVLLVDEIGRNGMYAAIHQGFEKADGNYFAYVNADDEVLKSGFETMYNHITKTEKCDFVYSNAKFFFEEENKNIDMIAKSRASFFLKNGIMPFVQPSSIYSKALYDDIGGLRYDIFRICGDLDMFQRMVLHGTNPYHIKEFSTRFLKYSGSLAAISQDLKKEELKFLTSQPKVNNFLLKIMFKLNL